MQKSGKFCKKKFVAFMSKNAISLRWCCLKKIDSKMHYFTNLGDNSVKWKFDFLQMCQNTLLENSDKKSIAPNFEQKFNKFEKKLTFDFLRKKLIQTFLQGKSNIGSMWYWVIFKLRKLYKKSKFVFQFDNESIILEKLTSPYKWLLFCIYFETIKTLN